MSAINIIIPMAINVLYTFLIILVGFKIKMRSIKSGTTNPKYFKSFQSQYDVSEQVRIIERHYDNQFQLPILFYITCTLFIALKSIDPISVTMAWAFIVSRALHAYLHLSNRNLLRRAASYAVNWTILLTMWAYLLSISF